MDTRQLGRASILVAEDESFDLQHNADRFRKICAQVMTAGDGASAFELRRDWKGSQLCVVDLEMPYRAGEKPQEEVGLELVRKLSELPDTIVVVLSAWANKYRREAEKNGAERVFQKGDIEPEELMAELRNLLAQLPDAPAKPPLRPGVIEPAAPELVRRVRERREWLGDPENVRQYAGQVVALHRGTVWGQGSDHTAAAAVARHKLQERVGEPGLPVPEDLSYVVVPEWADSDEVSPAD